MAIPFPFPDHVQDGVSVGLGDHLQLEYASPDGVADPATWTSYGPHLYMPIGILTVPPADHFIPTPSATMGLSTSEACLPRSLSPVCLHNFVCSTLHPT